MTTKQLSYQCQISVIHHLEPNLRLSLSRRCPSLKLAEQSTGLYLTYLQIDQNSIQINHILYRLSVIRSNGDGGRPYDVDEYGYQDYALNVHEDPNEILIDNRMPGGSNKSLNELLRDVGRILDERRLYQELRRRVLRDGLRSDNFIQLVTGKNVEQVTYAKKLHEALKYLLETFLSGRKTPIVVRKLSIGAVGILRIPSDIRLTVPDMELFYGYENPYTIWRLIDPLLTGPLDTLEVIGSSLSIAPAIFQNARCLIFNLEPGPYSLQVISHQRVHFKNASIDTCPEIVQLVRNWVENHKPAGTWYSFDFKIEVLPKSVLNEVKINHENLLLVEEGNSSTQIINLLIDDEDVLSIYYEKKQDLWLLNMQILS
ncbi:F-box C protein [Caenorhabditis elegans]|uniref:F-box C protein n=1 Tax=Caenorhabditis elegans TaxID=6239 RepID=A0A8S4QCF2_CAEEL|nr:F-box C protein [Caenorhabditis elegans]CAH2172166.1 F-box C protein [Caenorhabditis elegans]